MCERMLVRMCYVCTCSLGVWKSSFQAKGFPVKIRSTNTQTNKHGQREDTTHTIPDDFGLIATTVRCHSTPCMPSPGCGGQVLHFHTTAGEQQWPVRSSLLQLGAPPCNPGRHTWEHGERVTMEGSMVNVLQWKGAR